MTFQWTLIRDSAMKEKEKSRGGSEEEQEGDGIEYYPFKLYLYHKISIKQFTFVACNEVLRTISLQQGKKNAGLVEKMVLLRLFGFFFSALQVVLNFSSLESWFLAGFNHFFSTCPHIRVYTKHFELEKFALHS